MFVAVSISNYKKRPVIGKVTEVCDDQFTLNYLKGSYSTAWQPHIYMVKGKDGLTPWVDTIPKEAVTVLCVPLNLMRKTTC